MKLIVGLGNPGKKYQQTRHNLGFMVIDRLGDEYNLSITKLKHQSMYDSTVIEGEKVHLIKPITYMNRSGNSVSLWKNYLNLKDEDILVIYDDLDLQLGQIKIKAKGSSGGHKGIGSILNSLNSDRIPRVKLGIGGNNAEEDSIKYVLKKFDKREFPLVEDMVETGALAAKSFCYKTIEELMTEFNQKS